MNSNPRSICSSLARIFLFICLAISYSAIAGDPEPPVPPGTGTMKTLQEIYDKLDVIDGRLGGSPSGNGSYISIAQTGQRQPHEPGDDGDYQKGANWPEPRFTKNGVSNATPAGNGTVTDNLTGLVWAKSNFCLKDLNWSAAVSAVNDLQHGECQLSDGSVAGDWRLPNVNELASLLDRGQSQPQLPLDWGDFFVYGASAYWTSTTYGRSPDYAWVVDFTSGWIVPNKKTNDYWDKPCTGCTGEFPLNVWPVRNSH